MKQRHEFPREFQKTLIEKQTDYAGLSKKMGKRGYRLTKQFIAMMGSGKRTVPPKQLNRICETLAVDQDVRRKLHLAAAQDYGFEVGGA